MTGPLSNIARIPIGSSHSLFLRVLPIGYPRYSASRLVLHALALFSGAELSLLVDPTLHPQFPPQEAPALHRSDGDHLTLGYQMVWQFLALTPTSFTIYFLNVEPWPTVVFSLQPAA